MLFVVVVVVVILGFLRLKTGNEPDFGVFWNKKNGLKKVIAVTSKRIHHHAMELNNKILSFQTQPKNPSKWNSSGFPFILEDTVTFKVKYQKLQNTTRPSLESKKQVYSEQVTEPRTPSFEKPFFSLNSTIFKFFQENFWAVFRYVVLKS